MRYFLILLLIILSVAIFFQRTKKSENIAVVAKELDTPWAIAFLANRSFNRAMQSTVDFYKSTLYK